MKITEKDYMEMVEMAKKNRLDDLLKFIDSFSKEEVESFSLKNWILLLVAFIGTRIPRDFEGEQELVKILEESGISQEEFIEYLREGSWF